MAGPSLILNETDRDVRARCFWNDLCPVAEIISFHKDKKQVFFRNMCA